VSIYVILIIQGNSPWYLSSQQVVLELMVVRCSWREPKWPIHKDPGERKERFPWTWTCGVPMDVHVRLTHGSHGWRTRDPWMMH